MKTKIAPKKTVLLKKLHLASSSIVIFVVGVAYGGVPEKLLPLPFNLSVNSVDLKQVFRALMGLYLAMALYWVLGIFKAKLWRGATISNVLLMGGLALGRIISILLDGFPSDYFILGLMLELILMLWGIFNLRYKAWQ